ncbi:MFS transporter [Bradyrhizobium sp. AZCC 1699]|uniref:MFS transporter n=1 Tax=Bradyrhizobium sp. AZCC 1699 TaxID=3117024 RepID=UPI003FA56EF8
MPAASNTKSDLGPVLMACCLAMLAVGDNSTAIMAALPDMKGSLQLGPAELEWVVNAYLLTAAIFIIVGGGAADQLGARRSSVAGIAVFALASLLIALAPVGFVVVGARALQGLGAAFAVAGTLAAVTEAAPDERRPEAIGAWTGFLMLGFSIGPLVGGAVTHYAGWRFIFWLNVIAMVPAGLMLLRHPGARRPARDFDGLGRTWPSRTLHGDADIGIAGVGTCPHQPAVCHRPACAGGDRVSSIAADGDAAPSAAGRLRPVREPEFRDWRRPLVSRDVRHHDAAALLQPLCAGR